MWPLVKLYNLNQPDIYLLFFPPSEHHRTEWNVEVSEVNMTYMYNVESDNVVIQTFLNFIKVTATNFENWAQKTNLIKKNNHNIKK